MNVFTMVTLIVCVAVAGGVISTWLKSRRTPADDAANAAREAQIARLEERVAALEAVVADQGYELKQKFRNLEGA